MLLLSIIFCFNTISATPIEMKVPKPYFSFWNDKFSGLQYNNNCYNYATNRVTNNFAQPGEASDAMYGTLTCESVHLAASLDQGLEPTPFLSFQSKEKQETLIALVVARYHDFHWYRRDDNNLWTHKNGGTPATNLDESGRIISDPETADRGMYQDFCGYFKIKNFPSTEDEQNAGHVQIGNMTSLPGTSQVIFSIYSGRRNPSFSLKETLKNPAIAPQLKQLVGMISPRIANKKPTRHLGLGQPSLIIQDSEGLLFAKGTSINLLEWVESSDEQTLHNSLISKLK